MKLKKPVGNYVNLINYENLGLETNDTYNIIRDSVKTWNLFLIYRFITNEIYENGKGYMR